MRSLIYVHTGRTLSLRNSKGCHTVATLHVRTLSPCMKKGEFCSGLIKNSRKQLINQARVSSEMKAFSFQFHIIFWILSKFPEHVSIGKRSRSRSYQRRKKQISFILLKCWYLPDSFVIFHSMFQNNIYSFNYFRSKNGFSHTIFLFSSICEIAPNRSACNTHGIFLKLTSC